MNRAPHRDTTQRSAPHLNAPHRNGSSPTASKKYRPHRPSHRFASLGVAALRTAPQLYLSHHNVFHSQVFTMAIVTALARLKSAAPYSQSRPYTEPAKEDKETAKDYEVRTWRERLHVNPAGNVIIPGMTFKNCLSEAAKYLGMQIPGKGKATYTKHFEAGVLAIDPLVLPTKKDDVVGEWLYLNSDGVRGSGKRVWKCMPTISEWEGDVAFTILDPAISRDVFEKHIVEAGRYIGIGRFRPRNNGFYGRFTLESLSWKAE